MKSFRWFSIRLEKYWFLHGGKDNFPRYHFSHYRRHEVLALRFFCKNSQNLDWYFASNIVEHRALWKA